jgi:hypothetical protein
LRAIRSKLSYANVIATLALFLALGGSAVYAAAKIRSGQIAANAVKKKQLAKDAVTVNDFAKGALIVSSATGGGLPANAAATPPTPALPLPLSGKATFTPKKGAVGLVMAEAKATLASAAAGGPSCNVAIDILVNGEIAYVLTLSDLPDNAPGPSSGAPFTDYDWGSAPIGLTGGTQRITAQYNGEATDCSATSRIDQVKVLVQRSR